MSELYDLTQRYRELLLRRERQAMLELARAYGEIWNSLRLELQDVLSRLAAESASGAPSAVALSRERRLRDLLVQVENEVRRWTNGAAPVAADLQRFGAQAGVRYAGQMIAMTGSTFNALNPSAIEAAMGALQDGTPLASLLDDVGPIVRREWMKAITLGLTKGQNPLDVARTVRRATAMGMSRTMTISRTEMLRAYRWSAHESARQSDVDGWVWTASLSTRTCAACLAMHGSRHTMDEEFNDHPNGRCSAVYFGGGLSYDDARGMLPDAEQWLQGLGDDDLARALGPGRAQLYRSGSIGLRDMATLVKNDVWGDAYQPTALADLM